MNTFDLKRFLFPKISLPNLDVKGFFTILTITTSLIFLLALDNLYSQLKIVNSEAKSLTSQKEDYLNQLEKVKEELEYLKNQDQVKINKDLEEEIKSIQKAYNNAVKTYENLLAVKEKSAKTKNLDELFAKALEELAKTDYQSANQKIDELNQKIKEEETKLASSLANTIPTNLPQSNKPPQSGYSRQKVETSIGSFMASIIAADISSTKVIVDTASESDCQNNCPVLPLATYVSRNGGFAGINGTYFCPASYPSCASKTNSFDLLVMNKNKYYFNSANNVYSNNPAVIFGNGYIRFVSSASQWGRDTSVDGVISNYPLLIESGNIKFGGDDDPKKGSKGNRSFVANKGNMVFIGVIHNATVAESAHVLKALGMENAMNLDSGGSTALWYGEYKVKPGRDIPNAIIFVRR